MIELAAALATGLLQDQDLRQDEMQATPATTSESMATPTTLRIPGWTIQTNEALHLGSRYPEYTIQNMLDGDLKTAWIHKSVEEADLGDWPGPFAIRIRGDQAVRLDGILIVNGFAKTSAIYRRNNRTRQVQIFDEAGVMVADQKLPESMTWQQIRLPDRPYRELTIHLTDIRRGRDNDVAISDIRLLSTGIPVFWRLRDAMAYTPGAFAGDTAEWRIVDKANAVAASSMGDHMVADPYSPDSKYVICVKEEDQAMIEIYSTSTGQRVKEAPVPFDITKVEWQSESVMMVHGMDGEEEKSLAVSAEKD